MLLIVGCVVIGLIAFGCYLLCVSSGNADKHAEKTYEIKCKNSQKHY